MRIICRYSGVEFTASGYNDLKIIAHHPLMEVDTITLLSRAGDWAWRKLNETECRILFVALLKNTDLVDFRCAAIPANKTVQRYMELLIRTVGWRSKVGYDLPLPRYVINSSTRFLTNIKHWLDSWEDSRQDWESKGLLSWRRQKMELRTEALIRLIRSPKSSEQYSGILGRWALEASNAPANLHDKWLQIFRTKDKLDIWKLDKLDIIEVIEYMQGNLEIGTIMGAAVFNHLRLLLKTNVGGMEYGIGMIGEDDGILDFLDITKDFSLEEAAKRRDHPFIILDPIQQQDIETSIALAPENEPKREDYPSGGFIKALARWNLAQQRKNELEKFSEKQKDLDIQEQLDQTDNFMADLENLAGSQSTDEVIETEGKKGEGYE